MSKIDEKIKSNAKELKNDTYGKNMADKAKGYTTGAIVGGIGGFLAGYYFKGSLVVYTVIGIVAGGYIGYKVTEDNQVQQDFNFKKP
jgi:uncharacterized protein YcfJ